MLRRLPAPAILIGALALVCCGDSKNGTKDGSSPDNSLAGHDSQGDMVDAHDTDGATSGSGDGGLRDGMTANTDGGAVACVPLGGECSSSANCCGQQSCEAAGTGPKRCTAETTCAGGGQTCASASQCCSLSCGPAGTCVVPAAGSGGSLCKPSGTEAEVNGCAEDRDCCSNSCDKEAGLCLRNTAGPCNTLGETCSHEGTDASCCSRYCLNMGTAAAPDLRCARAGSCGARGEICALASDCCSGLCQDDGRCPTQAEIGGTLFAGEPCDADEDCAARACAPDYPGGPKVCQLLGGCLPAGDGSTGASLCTEDWQCCGYYELSAGSTQCLTGKEVPAGAACVARTEVGLEGLKTCMLQTTDKEVGEICKYADDVNGDGKLDPETELKPLHNCCCAAGVDCCVPSSAGVYRCRGGAYSPDTCKAGGESCQVPEECCSNICAPQPGGGFSCNASCVTDGLPCSRSADCCNLSCVGGVCATGGSSSADGGTTDSGTGASDAGIPADQGQTLPQCKPNGSQCSSALECCGEYCSSVTNTCSTRLY